MAYDNLTEEQKQGMFNGFRGSAREWWSEMQQVSRLPIPQSSPLYHRKMKLLSKAHAIRERIESIPGLSKLFSENGMELWPVAAIVAALGAMGWAAVSFRATSNEAKRLQFEHGEYQRLVSEGKTPEQAQDIVRGSEHSKRGWADVAYRALQVAPFIIGGIIVWRISKRFIK
jgi:hypothetical protein